MAQTCARSCLVPPTPPWKQDFTLRPAPAQQGTAAPPSLIRDDEFCRLWHKTDGQFRKPKLLVEIRLVNPVQYQSPENWVCFTWCSLWVMLSFRAGGEVVLSAGGFSLAPPLTASTFRWLFFFKHGRCWRSFSWTYSMRTSTRSCTWPDRRA